MTNTPISQRNFSINQQPEEKEEKEDKKRPRVSSSKEADENKRRVLNPKAEGFANRFKTTKEKIEKNSNADTSFPKDPDPDSSSANTFK